MCCMGSGNSSLVVVKMSGGLTPNCRVFTVYSQEVFYETST